MATDGLRPHSWRSLAHSRKVTTRRVAAAPPWELIEQSGRRRATRCLVPPKLLRDASPHAQSLRRVSEYVAATP